MAVKKKILIRIGSLRHGGAEKVLVTFLKNLPEEKYEIDLLLNLYSGKYLPEVPKWVNIKFLHRGEMITTNRPQDIPKKAARVLYQKFLKIYPKFLYFKILKNKNYDIEFAAIHGFRDEILNSPLKNSKKVVWIHNDLRKTQFHNYTDAEIRKFFGCDKILVISDQIREDFENLAKSEGEKNRIVRIYNPLDTEEVIKKSQEPRGKSRESTVENQESRDNGKNLKAQIRQSQTSNHQPTTCNQQPSTNIHPPTFVSVGTVFPQKGFDRLLKVHKKLLDEGLKHSIQIIGDGYDFENIKKLRTQLQVERTAEMVGFTDNPYPYFRDADFYILSSRYEGFPTVLFEAITLKKKMIATDVSGVREMLLDGQLGMVVENSEEGIYAGMKKAILQPEFFESYSEKLTDYEMPFNLENSVNSVMRVLDGL